MAQIPTQEMQMSWPTPLGQRPVLTPFNAQMIYKESQIWQHASGQTAMLLKRLSKKPGILGCLCMFPTEPPLLSSLCCSLPSSPLCLPHGPPNTLFLMTLAEPWLVQWILKPEFPQGTNLQKREGGKGKEGRKFQKGGVGGAPTKSKKLWLGSPLGLTAGATQTPDPQNTNPWCPQRLHFASL